jgi:tape measure domain-containing protein
VANTRTLQVKFGTEGLDQVLSAYRQVAKGLDDTFDAARKSIKIADDLKKYGEKFGLSSQVKAAEETRAKAAQQANQAIANSYRELRIKSETEIEAMKRQAFAAYRVIASASNDPAVTGRAQEALSRRLKELDAQLRSTAQEARNMGDGFTVAKGALAAFLGNLGSSALGQFQYRMQQLVGNVIQVGATAERQKVALETFLGSAEKAQTLLNTLRELAATTPFELPEINEAAKQLAAKGVEYDEIIPTIKKLGEVAAGADKPLSQILFVYGQIKDQGRAFAQDFNQLTNAGLSVKAMARALNVGENSLKKLVSEGKFGFAELQKVLKSVTSEGGQFYGLMDKLSGTTAVRLSNLNDAFTKIYQSIYDKISPALSEVLDGLITGLNKIAQSDYLDPLIADLKNFGAFAKSPDGAKAITEGVIQALRGLVDVIKIVAQAVQAFGPPILKVIKFVLDWKDAILLLLEAWAGYVIFGKIATAIGTLITAIKAAATALGVMQGLGLAAIGPAGWIALIGAGLVVLASNWDKVADATGRATKAAMDFFNQGLKTGIKDGESGAGGGPGTLVGITGGSGISSGPHLDLRLKDKSRSPTTQEINRFRAGGKPLTSYGITSGYGPRAAPVAGASTFHAGIDFGTPAGLPITVTVPIKRVSKPRTPDQTGGGGYVTEVEFTDGLVMQLLHQDPSVMNKRIGADVLGPVQPSGPPQPKKTKGSGEVNAAVAATPESANAPSGKARLDAFLDLLSKTEGADYNTLYGGGTFKSFAQHPGGGPAGRYQFQPATFNEIKSRRGLKDFGPESQDTAAIELLREKGALPYVLKGDWKGAIAKLTPYTWSSLPGGSEPRATMAEAIKFLNEKLSKQDDDTYQSFETQRQKDISGATIEEQNRKKQEAEERRRKQQEAIAGARRVQDLAEQTRNDQKLKLQDRFAAQKLAEFDSKAFANISGLKERGVDTSFYEQENATRRQDVQQRLDSMRKILELEQALATIKKEQQRFLADGKKQDAEIYGQKAKFIQDEIKYEQELSKTQQNRAAIEQTEQIKQLERDRQRQLGAATVGIAQTSKEIAQFRPDSTNPVEMIAALDEQAVSQFDQIKASIVEQIAAINALIETRQALGFQYQEEQQILDALKGKYDEVLGLQQQAVTAALQGAVTTSGTLSELLSGQTEQTATWGDTLKSATQNALEGVQGIMGSLLDGTQDLGQQLLGVVTGFLKQIADFFAGKAIQSLMGSLFGGAGSLFGGGGGGNIFGSLLSSGGASSFSVGGGGLLGALPSFHGGGFTGNGGEFLARLTGNEFVMNPAATSFYGAETLSRLNNLDPAIPLTSAGSSRSGSRAGGSAGAPITVNVTTPNADSFRASEGQLGAVMAEQLLRARSRAGK